MGWTKRQFVLKAFGKIGLASYNYDLTSDQLTAALQDLDAMMAGWSERGIKLGYPLTSNPDDSSLDTLTNVPDSANAAVYLNLGILIAPDVGKVVSQEHKALAGSAFRLQLSIAATPPEMQLPNTMPSGAGNRNRGDWRNRTFLNTPDESPLRLDESGQLIFAE